MKELSDHRYQRYLSHVIGRTDLGHASRRTDRGVRAALRPDPLVISSSSIVLLRKNNQSTINRIQCCKQLGVGDVV
jgi:hypothetical protein